MTYRLTSHTAITARPGMFYGMVIKTEAGMRQGIKIFCQEFATRDKAMREARKFIKAYKSA